MDESGTPNYFNPRPPRGGRPPISACTASYIHFNPRPPRGGRPAMLWRRGLITGISIHAPREGGDESSADCCKTVFSDFNPRPPRGGRLAHCASGPRWPYFNPRPPRGGRPAHIRDLATQRDISIHAPREGGDSANLSSLSIIFDFNPRPPRGGRPLPSITAAWSAKFQSTPPARGATAPALDIPRPGHISIHAPREGGDQILFQRGCVHSGDFNPRPPRGGRPVCIII